MVITSALQHTACCSHGDFSWEMKKGSLNHTNQQTQSSKAWPSGIILTGQSDFLEAVQDFLNVPGFLLKKLVYLGVSTER